MEQIIEKLSRFNRISVPLTESVNIQWYNADPFALGYREWGQIRDLHIIYGKFIYGSKNSVLGVSGKKLLFLHLNRLGLNHVYRLSSDSLISSYYQDASNEEIYYFLDAIPNDLALCLDIPWAKSLIELACRNN
jgi:hypothetical protein